MLTVIATALTMNSCYTHRVVGLLQERKNLPQYEKTEYEPYRIHENDEILYRLITMDETISKVMMEGTGSSSNMNNALSYRVYPDGTIELPFLEPIYVLGLTLDSAQKVVQEKMREMIPDAEIKLTINNKTFTVIGDIHSGVYPIYKEKLTIYQALALTGELMNSGDHQHVRIIRPTDTTEPEVLEFDIRTNTIIESKYYYVYPNDVIYVARTKGSFYKVSSYSALLGLITSSLSLLVSVINYTTLVP